MKKFCSENATLLALGGLVLFMSIASPSFFSARNLSNITLQMTIIGIIAVGMTMVILLGDIDLSVGSIVGLSAVTVTLLMQRGSNPWLAIAATILLVGVGIGLFNGFWVAHYKIPPFIITLGMMTIARGLALVLSGGGSIPVTDDGFTHLGDSYLSKPITGGLLGLAAVLLAVSMFRRIARKKRYEMPVDRVEEGTQLGMGLAAIGFSAYVFLSYRGLPVPVAILTAVILLGAFVLRSTRFGRCIYAVGGNEEAARLSGINVFGVRMGVYSCVTSLSALSGILLASRLKGASPNLGTMFELDAIAAVVIGGTRLNGGAGSIGGTVIGSLLIAVMNNGMSLLGVSSFYQLIIKGAIIIVAVWFDVVNKQRSS